MPRPSNKIDVYLEIGKKRTFAGAVDWPGWCRSGRNEASALQALFDYAPRYARVVSNARLGLQAPADVTAFAVVERLAGNATTDFGAPGIAPMHDAESVDDVELKRLHSLLKAYWRTFDATVKAADKKELRKGPRGGGRDLEKIIQHVLGADHGYLSAVGWKIQTDQANDPQKELNTTRRSILSALTAAAHGEIETQGPRGGIRWTPRYFVRRVAWHVIDHAWEIQDRAR